VEERSGMKPRTMIALFAFANLVFNGHLEK
jgi:hypothetical protein